MPKYFTLLQMILYMVALGAFSFIILLAMDAKAGAPIEIWKAGGVIETCSQFATMGERVQRVYVRSVVSEEVAIQPMGVKLCARSKTHEAHALVIRSCVAEKNLTKALTSAVKYVLMVCDFQPVEDPEWDTWDLLERPYSELEMLAWD